MKSKIGLIFVFIFITITIIIDFYANVCTGGTYCGLYIFLPAMPWIFIFTDLIPHDWAIYFYQLLNIIPIYFIGVGVGAVISKLRGN